MEILIKLKAMSLLAVLSSQGVPIYRDLNNLELIDEEPIKELLRICSELKLIDDDLEFLGHTNITDSQITVSGQSLNYESTSDLLTGQSLLQRLVNTKLKKNGVKKRIALVLDSKEEEYTLILIEEDFLKEIIKGLEDLEEAGEDDPNKVADYISGSERVFEIFTV